MNKAVQERTIRQESNPHNINESYTAFQPYYMRLCE